jgi:membrane protein YqaA with SNARE-associated domain
MEANRKIVIAVTVTLLAISAAYIILTIMDQTDVDIIVALQEISLRYGYIGLFFISIFGGSIIPVGSPIIVISFAALGLDKLAIIVIASIGFVIGLAINYYLAEILGYNYVERHMTPKNYDDLMRWWNRWGIGLIVAFAFVPVLPTSALAIVCGIFRVNVFYVMGINFLGSLFNSALLVYLGSALEFIFM